MIKSKTTYTFEQDGEVFPLPFQVDDYLCKLVISEDGLTAYLGAMARDEDAEDPFDGDEGDFFQFDRGRKHDIDRPELEDFKRIVRANPGRVFTVDTYGDGFKVGAAVAVKDCRNDKRMKQPRACRAEMLLDDADGYYITPEDATDPVKYAESAIESYSDWCTGEVYGAMCWRYENVGNGEWQFDESSRDSECWGFIGEEYATSERDERIEEAIAADNKN